MKIDHLDHLVLTVRDVQKTVAFYQGVLGMKPIEFGDGRYALKFGNQKINLHTSSAPLEPHALRPTRGSGDLCFITSATPRQVMEHLEALGVAVEEGPVLRSGATGPITSVYFRDPDGNLLEVASSVRRPKRPARRQ